MAVLLSNATAVRLRELIAASSRRDQLTGRPVTPGTATLEDASAQAPAWTVRWSESLSSYIVHIPPGAVRIWLDVPDTLSGSGENIKLVHNPVVAGTVSIDLEPAGFSNWYLFDGSSGTVWTRVSEGKVIVGMVPDYDHGAIIAAVSSAGGAVKVYQVARSPLEIIISGDDPDAPDPDPEAGAGSDDDGCDTPFPGGGGEGGGEGDDDGDDGFPGGGEGDNNDFPGKVYPCW